MSGDESKAFVDRAREAWNEIAASWDAGMGEGNDWQNLLIWPATERLIGAEPGMKILEIACGNGVVTRKLARLGAHVTAFDLAENNILRARAYANPEQGRIKYQVMDATDEGVIRELGRQRFDAAVSSMAFHDMPDLVPLAKALTHVLKPGAPFVFSMVHPCFNSAPFEIHDADDDAAKAASIEIRGYKTGTIHEDFAMANSPRKHPMYHRPLESLFADFLNQGFSVDGLEEPAFDAADSTGKSGWRGATEFPPVLVVRVRQR